MGRLQLNRPESPSWTGVGITFSKLPYAESSRDIPGADVAIVGAPFDEGTSQRPGARYGPRAIRLASWSDNAPPNQYNMDLGIDVFDSLSVVDYGDADVVPVDPERSHDAIRAAVSDIVNAGAIPIVLGGDHSVAHPDVGAVAEHLAPAEIGVVHFDAHADTAAEIFGVTRYSHGTMFRMLVEEGALKGENVVQVGLRGFWPDKETFDWERENGFRWHLMDEIYRRGIEAVVDNVVAEMNSVKHVFLSVDIDVCDPACAPGTGGPAPGGLLAREMIRAVRRVSSELPIAGMEVVEVAPIYDSAEITARLAQTLVLEALSGIALRKEGSKPGPEIP